MHFDTVVSIDPSLNQVWLKLLKINLKLKNYKHALTACNKVLEIYPNSKKYKEIKTKIEKLVLEFEIKSNPADPQARKELGKYYYKKGDLKKAKMQFETATSLESSLNEVWSILIKIDLKLKNYKHALTACKKVLEVIPESEKYSSIKLEIEKLLLEEAIKTNPIDSKARMDLGIFHYSQGDLSRAKVYLESAVSLEPSLKEVWEKLIELNLRMENYKNAIIASNKILEIEPKSRKYKKIKSKIEKIVELKEEEE
jgi:tetratricopeptide (TPR) repeat protein